MNQTGKYHGVINRRAFLKIAGTAGAEAFAPGALSPVRSWGARRPPGDLFDGDGRRVA
jgi:hypothetical protein